MSEKYGFVDIMHDRRGDSDLCWVLKDFESRLPIVGDSQNSEAIKKSILDSASFRYELKLLVDQTGRTEADLRHEAASIIDGMGHQFGMNSIRLMGYVLSKIIKQIFGAVYMNSPKIEQLRNLFRTSEGPVVLVPTHRSYADFLLISYVMFEFDMPMPVIAAAMDFQSMRFVGRLLRNCGAFFMRRSFANDSLYWSVFSHYVQALLRQRFQPLEFFIEGTRSRTNKALSPKIGLLGIIFELWLSSGLDVTLVPISISYERVLEEHLYAWELLGIPKPPESTSGLFRARQHLLQERHGNIFFNIGEPLSLSTIAHSHGLSRLSHNIELRFKPNLFAHEKTFLYQLAQLVVDRQQRSVVLSDWAVLIFVLTAQPRMRMPKVDLVNTMIMVMNLLRSWDGLVATHCLSNARDHESCSAASMFSIIDNCVGLHSGQLTILGRDGDQSIAVSKLPEEPRSLTTSDDVDGLIAHVILLGTCRNPVLFHVARESILLARLHQATRVANSNDLAGVRRDVDNVIQLMSREFVCCGSSLQVRQAAEARLVAAGMIDGNYQLVHSHPGLDIVQSAVRVHLVAYAVYGRLFLAHYGNEELHDTVRASSDSLLDQCRRVHRATRRWCVAQLPAIGAAYLEMCSLDMVRNCVSTFSHMLRSGGPSGWHDIRNCLDSLDRCLPADMRLLCASSSVLIGD